MIRHPRAIHRLDAASQPAAQLLLLNVEWMNRLCERSNTGDGLRVILLMPNVTRRSDHASSSSTTHTSRQGLLGFCFRVAVASGLTVRILSITGIKITTCLNPDLLSSVDNPQFLFQLLARCYPARIFRLSGTKTKPAISLR